MPNYIYWTTEETCEVCGTVIELDVYGETRGKIDGIIEWRAKSINKEGLEKAHAKSCPKIYANPYGRIGFASAPAASWRKEYGNHPSFIDYEMEYDKKAREEWRKKPFIKRIFSHPDTIQYHWD